jgi:glycyl-tRNA synthetase beta chain
LRRAALGIFRIISQTDAAIDLISLWDEAVAAVMVTTVNGTPVARKTDDAATSKRFSSYFLTARGIGDGDRAHRDMTVGLCQAFLLDRIVQDLRSKGARHDVVSAAIGHIESIEDLPCDLWSLANKQLAVRRFVDSDAGANLLAAHRRAVNILRIEEKRDGHAFDTGYEAHLLKLPEEAALAAALEEAGNRIRLDIEAEDFERAMEAMAGLRAPVDAFFEKVIVNDPAPELRRNRLRLLARLRAAMDAVADFSKIEA